MANDVAHMDIVIDRPGWQLSISPHIKVRFSITFDTAYETEAVIDPKMADERHFNNHNDGNGPHVYEVRNDSDFLQVASLWTEYKIRNDKPWVTHFLVKKDILPLEGTAVSHVRLRVEDGGGPPVPFQAGGFLGDGDYNDVIVDLVWLPL